MSKKKKKCYSTGIWNAIIIKNGRLMNRNEYIQDMEREVGWTDSVRYDDCDCFNYLNQDNDYKLRKISACDDCRRAHYEDDGNGNVDVVSDCRGNSLHGNSPEIKFDGMFTSYIGDEELTVAIVKDFLYFINNRQPMNNLLSDICAFICGDDGRKVFRFEIGTTNGKASIVLKHFADRVIELSMRYKDDNYAVLFGKGIHSFDSFKHEVYQLQGKKVARKIFNWIDAHKKDDGMKILVDEETNTYIGRNDWDPDEAKKRLVKEYGIHEEALDDCLSLGDIADAMNNYYGFKKFVVLFGSDVSVFNNIDLFLSFAKHCTVIFPD